MIVGRFDDGRLSIVDKMRERVRLGAGLDESGSLSLEAQQNAIACLRRMNERLRDIPAKNIRAVGTNTMRMAKNGAEFRLAAEQALGHGIEIISGREEARLIYLGVAQSMDHGRKRRLVVDIGGGSTECIVGRGFDVLDADSLYMGCVSYSLAHFPEGKVTKGSFAKAGVAAELELQTIAKRYQDIGWDVAVGCSGTIHAINRILTANSVGGGGITPDGLRWLKKKLVSAGQVERFDLLGLEPDRKPVIHGGVAILSAIFSTFGVTEMHKSPGALREGVLYDLVGRFRHEDVRDRTIVSLQRQYDVDLAQALRVEATALNCLDQVKDAWGLDPEEDRRLLSWAAHLHEMGLSVAHPGYHRHSAYLIANSYMAGFSRQEQLMIAAIVQGHRRKFRPEAFDDVPPAQLERTKRLIALFRLAARFHRSRRVDAPPEFFLTASGDSLTLMINRDWLEEHPLTQTDLAGQTERLAMIGFRFALEQLTA